jgi:hypothetical protein
MADLLHRNTLGTLNGRFSRKGNLVFPSLFFSLLPPLASHCPYFSKLKKQRTEKKRYLNDAIQNLSCVCVCVEKFIYIFFIPQKGGEGGGLPFWTVSPHGGRGRNQTLPIVQLIRKREKVTKKHHFVCQA